MKLKAIAIASALAMAGTAWAATVRDEPIQPIQPAKVTNPALVELGKKLYFDPRLSRSGFISCNSCHNLSMGGSDNLKTSIGDKWQQGPINSPTVLNSSLAVAQFWDGRAANLKEQAGGPIANPGEMAFTHDLAVARLLSHRIMVMKDGAIIEEGLTDRVLDDPREPYTQLLVASIPQA